MHYKASMDMRRMISFVVVALIVLSSCATEKPYYKTAEGKRKQRYYNAIQYGQKEVPKPKFWCTNGFPGTTRLKPPV